MKRIAILGSTGSIGQSALAVVEAHPDRLRAVALAAGENAANAPSRSPRSAGSRSPWPLPLPSRTCRPSSRGAALRSRACALGAEGLIAVATHPDADVVLFASSGTAALDAVLAAIDAGKTIALANKEILVMAGALDGRGAASRRRRAAGGQRAQRDPPVPGRPCLEITSSGSCSPPPAGRFEACRPPSSRDVTPEEALRHPTWRMGPKITIDSATLMNKGLEVIEARWLFDVGPAASTWSSTRSRSCTRWSSSWTARCSRSSA